MRRSTTFFLLLLSSTLLANAKLDKLMPKQIQQYTGIDKLSDDQKEYLAAWLAEHLEKKEDTSSSHKGKELFLSENVEGGKFLRLSDNSLWEVDPIDVSRSKIWLFPFPVHIQKNGRKDFPYTVTNKNTGSKVDVRKTGG